MGRLPAGVAVAALLVPLVVAASSQDLVPLRLDAVQPPPFEFSGVLAPATTEFTTTVHLQGWQDPSRLIGERILWADSGVFTVTELASGPAGHVTVMWAESQAGLAGAPKMGRLREASLTVLDVELGPEILLSQPYGMGQFGVEGVGSRCAVGAPDNEWGHHPADPAAVPQTRTHYTSGYHQLWADCEVDGVRGDAFPNARYYGLTLLLESPDLSKPRVIETGTFAEQKDGVPTGRIVTRLLLVEDATGPAGFTAEGPLRATMVGSQFLGLGRLLARDVEGRLEWGPDVREGTVGLFEAEGEFALGRASRTDVTVTGLATGGALAPHADAPGAGAFVTTVLAWSAAGVAALWVVGYAAWVLFTRLAPHRVLAHPRRAAIVEAVRADPGIEKGSLARTVGLGWARALHHLTVLERSGHVNVVRVGGRTAVFLANAGYRGREAPIVLMRRATHRRVHEALQGSPGLDQAALAGRMGLTPARVSQVLHDLLAAGLVRAERRGRRLRYSAA